MAFLHAIVELFLGLAEAVLDAIESASSSFHRQVALGVAGLSLLLLWVFAPRAMSVGLPLALFVLLTLAYVRDVASARRLLRRTVFAARPLPVPVVHAGLVSGRARSVVALAQAFTAAREGNVVEGEGRLREVVREDLGAWETRVLEASRALLAAAARDAPRAAQLAPLALPIGNAEIDRTLARAMVTAAWDDAPRLTAIQPALSSIGVGMEDLSELCRLRRSDLAGALDGERPLALDVAQRVADEATRLGDERLGHHVLSQAGRRGFYR